MSLESAHQKKTKRIASNSLVLFLRMFIITIVNLYTLRVVLKGLGELDYGIFTSIAGVVTISACISSTLSVALQRFYSLALGHQDAAQFNKVFSISINVVVVLAVLVVIVFESAGIWFVNEQLVIPADRLVAANWIYQFALMVFLLSLLQIPFTAAIFAHESMGTFALISTIDCLLRLAVACLISLASFDRLVFYSAGLMVVAAIVFCLYAFIASRRYAGCHYRHTTDKGMYRQLLSFSGWTLFGAVSNIGLIQGSIILLNVFHGNIIVTSFAIALQINTAFNALTNSMVLAFRPPMIKAYAEADSSYLDRLFIACNKFVVYVLAAVSLPLFFEMDTILKLWLGHVSDTTILFSRLIIIYIVCAALHNPITIIMQALGRIKEYHLSVESVCLMSVPLTWVLFHFHCPPFAVFVSMISLCFLAHCMRVVCIRHFYGSFSLQQYLLRTILPALLIVASCCLLTYMIHTVIASPVWRFAVVGCLSPSLLAVMAFLLGLSQEERQLILNMVPALKKGGRL